MKMISARSNNLTHRRDETTPCAFPPLNNSYFALMNKPSAHAPFPTARRRFTDTDTKIVEHCTTQCYQSRSFTYAKSRRTKRLHHNLPFVWSAVFSLFAVWQSATKQSSKQSNRKEIYLSKSTKSYLSKLISSKLHSRIEAVTLIMTVTGCIEYFRSFFILVTSIGGRPELEICFLPKRDSRSGRESNTQPFNWEADTLPLTIAAPVSFVESMITLTNNWTRFLNASRLSDISKELNPIVIS